MKRIGSTRMWSLACGASCFVIASAVAAPESGCDGNWKGHYTDSARGWEAEVDMTISGAKGDWISHLGRHKAQNSPCREQVFPVTVLSCTESEFNFRVDGESVLHGCPTFTARTTRTGPDTAEGVKKDGRPLQLIRQPPAKP